MGWVKFCVLGEKRLLWIVLGLGLGKVGRQRGN